MNENSTIKVWFIVGILLNGLLFVTTLPSSAEIRGSAHDFSGRGWGTSEICVFCHTPHNAKTPQLAPLWNHQSTSATYTLYSSPTLVKTPEQPRGPSKVCLSCHDGTVAFDSFANRNGTNFATGAANLGTDLSNDHPISIPWGHNTASGGSCLTCHSMHGGSLVPNLPLFDKYVECATCHEPHNKYSANVKMLRISLTKSQICLSCHAK